MKNSAFMIIEKMAEILENVKAQSRQTAIHQALDALNHALSLDGWISDEVIKKILLEELPQEILSLPLNDLPRKATLRKFFNELALRFEKLFHPPFVEAASLSMEDQGTALQKNEKIFFNEKRELLGWLKDNTPPEIPKIIRESYIRFAKDYNERIWSL